MGVDMDTATVLRRGVLALAGLGIGGTTVELIFLRHWTTATAAIVWVGIVALGAGFVALIGNPSAGRVRAVRILAAVGLIVAVAGIWFHVVENLDAGPLDRAFASRWDTMSVLDQWWTAITGGVGPAPTLAPGALAEISLALLLATLRHPAIVEAAA
jgi:ABC-type glucose/galactose transport system permease subunit